MTPDSRRAAILEAAAAVLLDSGGEISIRAVSQRAGISVGLINHHFGNRDGLMIQLYGLLSSRQLVAFQARLESGPVAPLDRADLFIECYFAPEMLDPRTLPVWMVFWRDFPRLTPLPDLHRQIFGTYCRILEDTLAECGVPGPRLRMTALGLVSMLDGLWLEYTLDPGSFDRAEAIGAAQHWIRLHIPRAD